MSHYTIRLIEDSDSRDEITAMLHRAYQEHAEAGQHFMASHQSADVTERRIQAGETYVLLEDSQILGVVTLKWRETEFYGEYKTVRKSASFGQFAVDTSHRRRGLGQLLLEHIEARAKECGCEELLLDTSQAATGLIAYYQKRGFRIVAEADWRPDVNYKSFILAKSLT
jgi:GNAT superfamily N-acetyltransferase